MESVGLRPIGFDSLIRVHGIGENSPNLNRFEEKQSRKMVKTAA